jgi:uncharacterized membrane protein
MAQVRESLVVHEPLERVWALFSDPDRWLEWNTELADMRDVRGPFDHPGAGYTQVWRMGPWEREGSWQVTACEPGRWRTVAGRTPVALAFSAREEFESLEDGTRVTVEINWQTPGGRVGRWFDRFVGEPMLRRTLRANAERVRTALARGD